MKVIRQRRPRRYTILDNRLLEDARLSYRARGVLAYLLSLPDDWETDSTKMSRLGREGRDAIRTALRELARYGYIDKRKTCDKTTGKWRTEWTVRDLPKTENQASENQASENQALLPTTDTKY